MNDCIQTVNGAAIQDGVIAAVGLLAVLAYLVYLRRTMPK